MIDNGSDVNLTIRKIVLPIEAVVMNKIDQYLKHIDEICGGDGKYYRITDPGIAPPVSIVSYSHVPESGCTTAFSFGLSSVALPEWINSRPELVISVNSLDSAWALAMGELIRNSRNRCPFSYGMMLNFGQQISDESLMSCFLVYSCTVLEEQDKTIKLADRTIYLSQLYPIFHSEIQIIKNIGVECFFHNLGIDFFDVKRNPYRVK